jgi:hypothetical protein
MTAHKTTEIPALNIPATAAVPAGTRRLGLALVVTYAGQQIGGAVGLAVIGSVTWTIVNNHVRHSLAHAPAGPAALPGSPVYAHALTSGVTAALTSARPLPWPRSSSRSWPSGSAQRLMGRPSALDPGW